VSDPSRPGRATLTSRLLSLFALVFLVVLVGFSAVVTSSVRTVLQRQITADMAGQARTAAVQLAGDRDDDHYFAIAAAARARLTVIGPDGRVVFDSVEDSNTMENHRGRPEVEAALAGQEGTDFRVSVSTGIETFYVAVPSEDGRVVRLGVTAEQLEAALSEVGRSVLAVAAAAGAAGIALVWLVSRRFAVPILELTDLADRVATGKVAAEPRRSSLAELDRLGVAIGRISSELGRRVTATEAERRTLEVVLAALPQGVILVAGDDAVLYANPAALTMVGPLPERIMSVTPRILPRCIRQARSSGQSQEGQFERGSPPRAMSVVATKLPDDERVLVVIADITERRRIEAMRRDFVADASHELKTPVAAVLASAEALQLALERDPAKAAEFGERVESSARQLATIVADLLDLSRLEASDRESASVDVRAVVEAELAKVRDRAGEAGIELQADLAEAIVDGSASDLGLAVRNLLDNALRYTDAGGTITVSVSADDRLVTVSVEDTGAGIPSRALGRVFERFYRVDEARSRDTGGTGLGLSIVRHVVERHGGTVTVTSQLGAGSRFTVELPAAGNAER
jgi:two-component system, OmpR family, phosphate regulon sensor histidine kinase PhoR